MEKIIFDAMDTPCVDLAHPQITGQVIKEKDAQVEKEERLIGNFMTLSKLN
jgi:hypothetical protein